VSLKNVLRLAGVYSRASRLISKRNFRRYRDKRWETYAIYGLAVIIGIAAGAGIGYIYTIIPGQAALHDAIVSFFVTLPTLCILYSLVMMMMYQIRQTGVKVSVQPLYWFPVTWEDHTAASVLASSFSGTLWITLLICFAVLAVSVPLGLVPLAALTCVGLFLCLAFTGTTMEMFRIFQVGISGAIMRAAGRSAVWIRFVAMIVLFTVVYVVYFAATQSMGVFFNAVAQGQLTAWFVPYVWPGLALYAFSRGMWLQMALFSAGSLIFGAALFLAAVKLNARYALSDVATISVSKAYSPGKGLPGRLGLSGPESAVVKKDFRGFTRRSELMYVFIMPIVLLLATFMPLIMGNGGSSGGPGNSYYFLYMALLPSSALSMTLGMSIVGSEGERRWFLAQSPLLVKSFVKAKSFLPIMLGSGISVVFSIIGFVILSPTSRMGATGLVEGVLLAFAVGMAALTGGIAGADFRELPRPRMIRSEWSLITTLLCLVSGLLVILPVLVYGVVTSFGVIIPGISVNGAFLYVAWLLSGIIALAVVIVFYRISVMYAGRLLGDLE